MPEVKTKNFSKSKVSLKLPYLLTLQKESWEWFWQEGLKELFSEIFPIRDYTGKEFELWFIDYKLDEPKYKTDLEAKENNDSYEASLRVKAKIVNLKTKDVSEQEVFLADFPLMTKRGTFIVNGIERVAIAQLIRSPGAFFSSQGVPGRNRFGAKIIPNRGAWLEFETEASGFIGVKVDRKRKVAATTLIKALAGLNNEQIKQRFQDVDNNPDFKYIEQTLKRDAVEDQGQALVEIYRRLRPGDLVTPDTARELIENTFFNFERYDLSKVGRWRMWQRLPGLKPKKEEKIVPDNRVLNPEDIIEVMREIIRPNNDPEAKPDEIDHLGNRRVRRVAELMQNRIRVGLMRMERHLHFLRKMPF